MINGDLQFYKPKEIAKRLQLNTLTIYEYIRSGKLKASKFGRSYRISSHDLETFIENHTVKN